MAYKAVLCLPCASSSRAATEAYSGAEVPRRHPVFHVASEETRHKWGSSKATAGDGHEATARFQTGPPRAGTNTPPRVRVVCVCVTPLALALSRRRSLLGTYLLGK